jgi:hypothetical protein
MRMTKRHITAALAIAALLCACSPNGGRPGTVLSGEPAAYPTDWTFTDSAKEIAIQVHTPYLLPHAVTIWCVQVNGQLYVGASAPETKRWPGWVDNNPDVKLGIDKHIYEVRLTPLTDAAEIAAVQQAYTTKYQLPDTPPERSSSVRYWHVTQRPS